MTVRDLIQISEITFVWEETPTGFKTHLHDMWAVVTQYGNGTAHFNIQNQFSNAGAPQVSVAAAKKEAEALMRSIIERDITEAIKTLDRFCTFQKETASC